MIIIWISHYKCCCVIPASHSYHCQFKYNINQYYIAILFDFDWEISLLRAIWTVAQWLDTCVVHHRRSCMLFWWKFTQGLYKLLQKNWLILSDYRRVCGQNNAVIFRLRLSIASNKIAKRRQKIMSPTRLGNLMWALSLFLFRLQIRSLALEKNYIDSIGWLSSISFLPFDDIPVGSSVNSCAKCINLCTPWVTRPPYLF